MWKLLVLSVAVVFFIGCQSEGDRDPVQDAPQQMEQPEQPQQPQQPDQPPQQDRPAEVNIPAGDDGVVHHYICVDQCEGGHSETPGMCPVCNQQLAHNRAWHEQPQQQQQQQQQQQMQQQQGQQQDPRQGFDPMRGGDQQPPQQQQQQQPQQQMQQVNIPAGDDGVVHHYICANRCEGGHSETPGVCPVCSEQLAHNQAWHQQ